MSKSLPIIFAAMCFTVSTISSSAAATSVQASATIGSFDIKFRGAIKENKIPGAAYAIIDHDTIAIAKGYGTRAVGAKLPVTKDTVFRLASVSKTFSAELAALLIAEGKLNWNDRVVDAVPGFRLKTPGYAERVQVKHLLSHSAGLLPNSYDNMLEDGWTLDKIIPRFKKLKPLCKPGNCYGYQNIIFSFIEPVIEKSTGETFESLVKKRLFVPLGMANSSMGLEGFLSEPDRAEPHVFTRKGWRRVTVKPDYYNVAPAAGVNASVEDMAKWIRAQMGYNADVLNTDLLETVTTKRVRTRREMNKQVWRPYLQEAHYGYGWRIYKIGDEEIIMHAGGVSGFRSLIGYSKTRSVGLVMLMNAETRSIDQLAVEFWAALLNEPNTQPLARVAGR